MSTKETTIPELNFIKEVVEQVFNIEDISVKKQTNHYVQARSVYYQIARETTTYSTPIIGGLMNRDHATVLHSKKVFDSYKDDPFFNTCYATCKKVCEAREKKQPDEVLQLFKDSESILKELENLKTLNELLSNENKNLIRGLKHYREYFTILNGLTDQQIEMGKERLKSYASMCKDQNRRNPLFVSKHEALNA